MAERHKIRKSAPLPPIQPRQMTITFESSVLRGMTHAERLKALTHLAHLLMQAAGIAVEEHRDER